jgi:NitT/TauT family transport system substrate-binding protein
VALGASLCASGALAADKPVAKPTTTPPAVRVAVFPGTITALLYLAEDMGLFARHGLQVSFTRYDAGIRALEDLVGGKIDVATVMEFPFAIGRVPIDQLRIIGSIASTNNVELIMRRDRGISRPADCKGKRIGVVRGTFGEFFLGVFLAFHGVRLPDVQMVDLQPPAMHEALTQGTVDGVIVWQPFVHPIAQALGDTAVRWPAQGAQDSYALLVAEQAYVRGNPNVVERLLRALLDAQDYLEQHPAEARSLVNRHFGYEQSFLLAMWSQNRLAVRLTQDLLTLMDDEARWALQQKRLPAPALPNFLNQVHFDTLEKLRPEAVTIIR